MKRQIMLVLVIVVITTSGCLRSTPLAPTPAPNPPALTTPEADNAKTPDLIGGTEARSRTVDDYKQLPELASQFPNVLFYSGPHSLKQAALTFDDGPDVHFTTQILDILKQNGIKATFFIVGKRAETHPEMVRRIVAEGHAIGNHTWDPPDIVKLTPEQIKAEISKTDQTLANITGYHPSLFRPPYGAATPEDIREIASLGYKVIDWSVDTRDWAGTPVPQIMDYVRKEFRPGGIILQHCAGGKGDNLNNTIAALPEIIATLKAQGYSFVTVPNLLNIPATRI